MYTVQACNKGVSNNGELDELVVLIIIFDAGWKWISVWEDC